MAVEWVKVDKYGHKLGEVMLAGLDCNLEQVKHGLARLGLGVPKKSKQS